MLDGQNFKKWGIKVDGQNLKKGSRQSIFSCSGGKYEHFRPAIGGVQIMKE